VTRHRTRLCDGFQYTGERKTTDFDSDSESWYPEVVPKSAASEHWPANSAFAATTRVPRFGRIGVSNKVPVDSRSAKRSDVPGVASNKTRVQSWGSAHGRSPLMAATAMNGRFAEGWWVRRAKTEEATSSWAEIAPSQRAPGKHEEGQETAP